ncbi:hypothetical protein OTU49_002963 [Cherax quadricarinatus]|uniref:Uncharacterized protein n=3 Tax=Cherax quadricarinatus TaxID=27406 RepID=A0AAW0X7U8_CHEQU
MAWLQRFAYHNGMTVEPAEDTESAAEVLGGYYSYIRVSPLHSGFFYGNSTDEDGGLGGAPMGLALLLTMVSLALAIAIIALLISKMRRRQSTDSTDLEMEVTPDPYLQAIMFPTEPRPEWHRHLRHVIHKAGQKIFKKPEHHDTNIPDNLRYQLKYIYVY